MRDEEFDDLTRMLGQLSARAPKPRGSGHAIYGKLADKLRKEMDKLLYGIDEQGRPNEKKFRAPCGLPQYLGDAKPSPKKMQPTGTVARTAEQYPAALESMPREIFDMIVGFLDNVSRVCVANASSRMRSSGILQHHSGLTLCEKWLLMCRLEKDQACQYPKMYICCFCKVKHPRERFVASNMQQCWKGRRIDNARVRGDPMQRYCWEYKVRTSWEDKDTWAPGTKIRWVQKSTLTCLHCQADVSPLDERTTGCENCNCSTCPRAELPMYMRYGPPVLLSMILGWKTPRLESLLRIDSREIWVGESGLYRPIPVEYE